MISKVVIGSSFLGCCKYVCENQERATILTVNGVRDGNYLEMAHDFEMNRQQQPNKKTAVFHGILSFPHGENPDELMLTELAEKYLAKLGLKDAPYAIVSHNDKKHSHVHVISSFIDLNGKTVDDSWIGLRAKKIAQELTQQYNLIPANQKHIASMNLSALNDREKEKFKVYLVLKSALQKSHSFDDFKEILKAKGIELQFKYRKGTEEIQGISFKIGNYAFKGSEIDRSFSYQKIKQVLERPHNIQAVVQENNSKIQPLLFQNEKPVPITTTIDEISTPFSNPDRSDDFDEMLLKRKKKRGNDLTR